MRQPSSLLVTGSHRSGTTWVGRVLAMVEGYRYIQEPFNRETLETIAGYRLANMYAHVGDERESELLLCYRKFLEKQGPSPYLLKDPIALFSAPWLQREFNVQVVCMVRHPAGFVSSLLKWEWEFHFGYLSAQPKLMAQFTPELREQIEFYSRERQEALKQACLLWKVIYSWVHDLDPKRMGWQLVRYEDLAFQPQKRFRQLFRRLGLKWTADIAMELQSMTHENNPTESTDPGFRARSSRALGQAWKHRLSLEQIEQVRRETAPVWQHYYRDREWKVT